MLSKLPKPKLAWFLMTGLVLTLVAAACSSQPAPAPAPAPAAPAIDADALRALVQDAVKDAVPEPVQTSSNALSAGEIEQIVAKALEAQAMEGSEGSKKELIRFHDGQWQSLWINNAIAMHITENGYGYPVDSIEGTSVTMQVALPRGDLDVNMEMWRANIIDWVNEQVSERTIVDLGQIFETSTQGWYVPTYMIEGDAERGIDAVAPDLKTVADLVKYKDLFADPEDSSKGLLVNCIIGWNCQKINRIKLNTYGLDTDYNIIEPGAAAGIDAAIASAYNNGEAVLSYYWEPTWLLGAYKMTLLEEPAYSDECNAAIQAAMPDFTDESVADQACAYEVFDVHKFVSTDLLQRAPDVAAFLKQAHTR